MFQSNRPEFCFFTNIQSEHSWAVNTTGYEQAKLMLSLKTGKLSVNIVMLFGHILRKRKSLAGTSCPDGKPFSKLAALASCSQHLWCTLQEEKLCFPHAKHSCLNLKLSPPPSFEVKKWFFLLWENLTPISPQSTVSQHVFTRRPDFQQGK